MILLGLTLGQVAVDIEAVGLTASQAQMLNIGMIINHFKTGLDIGIFCTMAVDELGK